MIQYNINHRLNFKKYFEKSGFPWKIRKSWQKSGFLKTVIVPLLRDDDHQHPAPELSIRQSRQPLQMLEAAGEATVI